MRAVYDKSRVPRGLGPRMIAAETELTEEQALSVCNGREQPPVPLEGKRLEIEINRFQDTKSYSHKNEVTRYPDEVDKCPVEVIG